MRNLTPDQITAAVSDDDLTGFILVRPIYLQLLKFEKAAPAMSFYFPELVEGIDVGAQLKRFDNFQFASASEKIASGDFNEQTPASAASEELNRELNRGDRQIAMQNGAGAEETFQHVLDRYPNLPRALYGLAIASVLQKQGDKAEALFEQLVRIDSKRKTQGEGLTPDILAWSHIYLGRIDDLRGDRKQAVREYEAALHVQDAPEEAMVAAQNGVAAPYRPRQRHSQP
jgi:tetratricopeptide (TPR) repeat protein